jgi:hypothetical protein
MAQSFFFLETLIHPHRLNSIHLLSRYSQPIVSKRRKGRNASQVLVQFLSGKWAWAWRQHPWHSACQQHYVNRQHSFNIFKVMRWTYRPVAWPAADLAAVLAFSAFLTLWAAVRLSLPSLMAAWRAAERASGRCARRSLITSREAPTMARWDLT